MSNGAPDQEIAVVENELLCNDPAKDAALRELCKQTGYTIKQENGQRKYGGPPPDWNDMTPGKGCEIFVGKLPRDLYEDELVPVLETCGRIYELRLMMDFNGNNRGFAFVKYTTQKEAKRALKDLNNHEIRKGRLLGVCKSVDNCRLFVGGIPKSKQKQEILVEMQKLAEGVVDVIVYPAAADKTKNRGFAFVEFQDHHTAAMARRKLQHTRPQVWGHPLAVDWAEPEVEVDDDVMAQVKILYVRNLMLHTTEDQLEREFTAVVPPEAIERVKKIRDYGFVHFNSRDNAIKCMKVLNGKLLDGAPMEVTLAKPVDRETYVRYTRANNRPSTENADNQSTPFSAFVTTTYDPRFDPSGAGAYSFTPSGPIYYGQVPYATTALPTVQQLQRYPMPTAIRGGIAPQAVIPNLGTTTIGAAGVPLGIPGATTGVTSTQSRLTGGGGSGGGSLRSGRNRAGAAAATRGLVGRSGGYLNVSRGYANAAPTCGGSEISVVGGNLQVSDDLLQPAVQQTPQLAAANTTGYIGPTGAGREIRLTTRYGTYPYQPVIAQNQSEIANTAVGGILHDAGPADASLQPSLGNWAEWPTTFLIPGGAAAQQQSIAATTAAATAGPQQHQQQQQQHALAAAAQQQQQQAAVHPYQIVYLT